jgi:hypothetical protein
MLITILFHIIGLVAYELASCVAYWIILRFQLSFLLMLYVRKVVSAEGSSVRNRILIFLEMFLTHFLARYLGMLTAILILELCELRVFTYLYIVVYLAELVTFLAYRHTQVRPANIRNAHEYGTTLGIVAAAATKTFLL